MVDNKVEMSDDGENFVTATTNDPKNVQELTQYTLLQTIQEKFQNMSDQILNRIDEMGTRIDDLEKNIGDLMTQAGVEGAEK
ncbi:PREDICTED: heat shock factor-binding protein 1 isoform X2 [Nicrophorus vespilloides]|uniref:Heat shock factor-binding protein 1 isoform X2 n=1 Tax=Nicrophorus vespilloides TaxID=110193 RepID=A0ABM1N5M7_NICVS|nr:PREDICTED: heat shock factor-binding protein 1 isoform X2 [Nicrophorus vespilloides]